MVLRGHGPELFPKLAFLGIYHPYRKDGEKNPEFDMHSGRILDVKDGKEQGVEYFRHTLENLLELEVPIAIVPSHDPSKTDSGLKTLAKKLAAAGRVDATDCLVRSVKITKLAIGGDRSINVHLGSIVVVKHELIAGQDVLLLDDVSTTGNSLRACEQLLQKAGAKRVQKLALGKTQSP